jgi:hypothetical protein
VFHRSVWPIEKALVAKISRASGKAQWPVGATSPCRAPVGKKRRQEAPSSSQAAPVPEGDGTRLTQLVARSVQRAARTLPPARRCSTGRDSQPAAPVSISACSAASSSSVSCARSPSYITRPDALQALRIVMILRVVAPRRSARSPCRKRPANRRP